MADVLIAKAKTRTTTAIRFPEPLHEKLKDAAEERSFSVNFMVVKAVEEFLGRLLPPEEIRLTRQ
jgi:predicted HicB family RNase H-like nuclease